MSYKQSLKKREKALKIKIKEAEAEFYSSSIHCEGWSELLENLNQLRIDLTTVNSRLNNLGKVRPVIEEFIIEKSILNK